jgi:hypothetical protein
MDEEVAGRVAMVESLEYRGGFLHEKALPDADYSSVHILTT